MSAKTEYYAKVASDASRDLTRSVQNWTGFLTTAGRLYRYSFPDQLMIYAQRPDATACAEYDLSGTCSTCPIPASAGIPGRSGCGRYGRGMRSRCGMHLQKRSAYRERIPLSGRSERLRRYGR